MPRVRHFAGQEGGGELLDQLLAPIRQGARSYGGQCLDRGVVEVAQWHGRVGLALPRQEATDIAAIFERSEEHTSELQALAYLVCRLLLEKKTNSDLKSLTP